MEAVTFSQVIQPTHNGPSWREAWTVNALDLVILSPQGSCVCSLLVKPNQTRSQRTRKPIDVLQIGLSPRAQSREDHWAWGENGRLGDLQIFKARRDFENNQSIFLDKEIEPQSGWVILSQLCDWWVAELLSSLRFCDPQFCVPSTHHTYRVIWEEGEERKEGQGKLESCFNL